MPMYTCPDIGYYHLSIHPGEKAVKDVLSRAGYPDKQGVELLKGAIVYLRPRAKGAYGSRTMISTNLYIREIPFAFLNAFPHI